MGTTSTVKFQPSTVSGAQVLTLAPSTRGFLLNDFAVTTDSQSYVGPNAFVPLTMPSLDVGPSGGDNHNSVVSQRIADLVVGALQQLH
jgi:hypothetical protein